MLAPCVTSITAVDVVTEHVLHIEPLNDDAEYRQAIARSLVV